MSIALATVAARWFVGIHTIDDAYITFRYARNIANGEGFCYNPPDRVLGTSTPLFTLVLVPAAAWGLSLERASFVMAIAADLVTIGATAALLAQAGFPVAGLVTAAMLAVSPAFIQFSMSGVETSLYVALIMATLWAFARDRRILCGIGLGLVAFCRPDGVLLSAVLGAIALVRGPRTAVMMLAPAAVIVVPWIAFATWYFGSPLPVSVVAKWAQASDPLASLRVIRAEYFAGHWVLLTVVAAVGVWLLWRRAAFGATAWIGWAATYTAVFTVGRAFNHYLWYFSPIVPLYFAGVGVSSEVLLLKIGQRLSGARMRVAGRAIAIAAVAALMVGGPYRLLKLREWLDERTSVRESLYESVASRVSTIRVDCALAATEIGALGYHYRGPILDLAGLVSPEAIGRAAQALRVSRACWLVAYDDHLRALDSSLEHAAWFRREFCVMERHHTGPRQDLVVYRRNEP